MPTFTYSGEFKVTVKTVAPNYDYTVYNMATEPVVKSVEKYYGGHKSCFFRCGGPEPDGSATTTIETHPNEAGVTKEPVPLPLRIEMQRHHFNTPNLPAIFGLGSLAGNPKGLSANVWEPVQTNLAQHDYRVSYVDVNQMSLVFSTALQKNTFVTYFGLSNVFSAVGGFLVSLKGIAILIYGFVFGKMIKRQFAQMLYRKNQVQIEENQAKEAEAEEKKGNEWENNAIDKTRKK